MFSLDCNKLDLMQPNDYVHSKPSLINTESEMQRKLSQTGQPLDSDLPFGCLQGVFMIILRFLKCTISCKCEISSKSFRLAHRLNFKNLHQYFH